MYKLLQEFAKGNEITISLTRVSAKGGFAVLLAFIFAVALLLRITL